MPPKHRDIETTIKAYNAVVDSTEEEIRRGLMASTVKETTLNTYWSEVKHMMNWARLSRHMEIRRLTNPFAIARLEDFPISANLVSLEADFVELARSFSKKDLYTYFAAHAKVHPIQFGRARAALRLAQLMAGTDLWAISDECITMEKGATAAAAAAGHHGGKPRGTLTTDMADKLIGWVKAKDPFMAEAMAVQVGACLRISELVALTPKHIHTDGIVLTEQKRDTAATITSILPRRSTKKISNWKAGRHALAWLTRQARGLQPDQLIFPRSKFTIRQYNAMIRAGAIALHFPSELRYDGSHILRHTGVGVAVSDMLEKLTLDKSAELLQMSIGTVLHYSLSLQERINKLHIPEFAISRGLVNPATVQIELDSDDDDDEEEAFQEIVAEVQISRQRGRRLEMNPPDPVRPTIEEVEATRQRREANSVRRQVAAFNGRYPAAYRGPTPPI